MRSWRVWILFVCFGLPSLAATFGTVVPRAEGFSDIILDAPRQRLYMVNTSAGRIDVYLTNTNPPRFSVSVRTAATPLSAALSRSGKFLYVTAFDAASLDIIDLDRLVVSSRITLPAKPEGVAVGFDERVVITTIGTGQGQSTLLVYDPNADASHNLLSVVVTPPAATPPQLPPPNGRIFLSARSKLIATNDGRFVIGVNGLANNTRTVFVYEVTSATVLRSRSVSNLSNVLAVSPDGSRFMAGITMFDTETLAVLAQQNAANAPFVFPGGNANNFNLQQNQGGSVFSPDGATLYSAFNIAPVQNPPARANVSRLLLSDPDNLLIRLGLQMPENLAGKMVITPDGATVYGLSESGFLVLPVSTIFQNPIAMPDTPVVLLANDQCGVTAGQRSAQVSIRNIGGGARMTATAQLLQLPPTGPQGLGGFGGPGGGGPGGNIIILLPPVVPGAPGGAGRPGAGGAGFLAPNVGNQQAAIVQSSPILHSQPGRSGTDLEFNFSPLAARALGTVSPHDFLIQSPEAINIPPNVRVYQNNRNAEAKGAVMALPQSPSASEGLVDMLVDNPRQRLYIANSGMNRVEVFDMRRQVFLDPIKVGQLPRSLAFGNDGVTLYVANTGGESISIVDLDQGRTVGRVKFPPTPLNTGFSLITPNVIASSLRGPQILMSDGTLWKIVGDTAVPRTLNPGVFGSTRTVPGPVRTMAATPGGEFVLLLAGNGNAYLFDAQADDYIVSRQVISPPIQGIFGPIAAGPRGRYYLVNGLVLNESLTPIGSAPTFTINPGQTTPTPTDPNQAPGPIPGPVGGFPTRGGAVTVSRPVSGVAAVGNTTFARFSQPIRLNQNQLPTDSGIVEIVDVTNQRTMAVANALEGPLASGAGNQRVNANGRTMAVDAAGATVYALTTSGLSVIPIDTTPNVLNRPAVAQGGVVNTASYLPTLAPGGLVSIFGRNLAASDLPGSTPLPAMLGGTCVTLNNQPLPLLMASGGQLNAQIPPNLASGRYPLVVRSIDQRVSANPVNVVVSKFAPAVFVDQNGQAAIFHSDGRPVSRDHPASRDEPLVIYATGLGATKGGRVVAGSPSPASPLAVTEKVQVFFGNPGYKQAEMIVEWSGLTPGMIGLYQLNIRVPGFHMKGDDLPVTLRIGGVNSPTAGPAVPRVSVE